MKRLHIHLRTDDLEKSVAFYEAMFGTAPTQRESDYAKWLLDDPRAHVSLSSHQGDGVETGIDHVGISIAEKAELDDVAGRLRRTGESLMTEAETTCCYAQSNKYWARDPQGAVWELFQTFGTSEKYGADPDRAPLAEPCCTPENAA